MTSPRIIIPHGLAAEVLRALQGGAWMTAAQIVDAIDEASGAFDDEESPGVGFSTVWRRLFDLVGAPHHAVDVTRRLSDGLNVWRLNRG